jgi:hypothetical protein
MGIQQENANFKKYRQCRDITGKSGTFIRFFTITIILAAMIAVMVVPTGAADTEGATTNPTVTITDYKVTPAVLLPGDKGTITLTLKNTAQSASIKENTGIISGGTFANTKSTDINVFIERIHLEGNGITILTESIDRLGELGPGQSVPVTFVIQAPAKDGIYFPEAWIDVKDGRSTRYPMTVNVNTDISTQKKPALSVSQSLPDRVAPGDDCSAGITITNTGLTRASDISMGINSTTKSLVLSNAGRYYWEHLDPGEQTNLTINLKTDKNTLLGIDPVTLTISYHNPDGTTEQQIETVGIPVKGKADIAIKSFSTDPIRPVPGNTFILILRVENTGTDRATSVQATIDSPFAGTKTAFIGSIDKNSDAPAIFYLQATKDGTVPVNLTINYSDDFGTHTITEQAVVTTSPSSGMTTVIIAILVICAVMGGLYWYYRIRSGKTNGK